RRDDFVREWLAARRIGDRPGELGKIARPHLLARHAPQYEEAERDGLVEPRRKEERAVLDNASALLRLKFVQDIRRLPLVEEQTRIQRRVLVLVVYAAMESVAAALRDHVEVGEARSVGAGAGGGHLHRLEEARIIVLVAGGVIGDPVHGPSLLVPALT